MLPELVNAQRTSPPTVKVASLRITSAISEPKGDIPCGQPLAS